MVATSRVVLRGALAAAIAVLAFFLPGTIAVAQQIAVNTENQAASDPSPDEDLPGEAVTRQIVSFHTSEAPGTIIIDTGERHLYLVQPNDLAIRYGIGVGRVGFQWSGVRASVPETSVAGLARPTGNGRTAALSASVHGGRSGQSPRGASPLSRSLRLPHPRNQPAGDDRARRFVGMLSPRQRRRNRPLRPRPGRRKSPRQAVGPRFLMRARGLKVGGLCREGIPASPANVLAPAHRLEGHAGRAIPAPLTPPRGTGRGASDQRSALANGSERHL